MKNTFSRILFVLTLAMSWSYNVKAQNWQYVGTPFIAQNIGVSNSLYFEDLEANASGDLFVGYWEYSQTLRFTKFSSGSWSQLASPGTSAVNSVDIEVNGNNYYFAYSGVRGSNMYAFVKKYNGTSWVQLGDSMLLGNSGSGGWFDFVLDNNEKPTLIGAVASTFGADKQVMQFNGTSWSSLITLTGSAATVFQEGNALFDAQNKLYLITQGYILSPFKYFALVNKIDAGVRTIVGDTLVGQTGRNTLKMDANQIPYVCFNLSIASKVLAYKLNGSTWSLISDTTGESIGTMLSADLSGDGKFVFITLGMPLTNSTYMYNNGVKTKLDSINIQGFALSSKVEVLIPKGSSEVYMVISEIKTGAVQDISVIKHSLTGSTAIKEITDESFLSICPNPGQGVYSIKTSGDVLQVNVYNALGEQIEKDKINLENDVLDLTSLQKGIYYLQVEDKNHHLIGQKIIFQ